MFWTLADALVVVADERHAARYVVRLSLPW